MSRLISENQVEQTRAALVAVMPEQTDEELANASLHELARLLDTAGGYAAAVLVQRRPVPDAGTYLGSGKCAELKALCENEGITLVVADSELTPLQIRNLEEAVGVPVIDRSMLILDIFALHAASGEGKLQVELAQLKYTIPRLNGRGKALSRQGGGIGTRGPGESKLESDRRHLRRRIAALEEQLQELAGARTTQRKARERSGIFKIAVAGYTNAGKSTLLNALTDAQAAAEDKLFATLDPTTRRLMLPSGSEVLLTDTVGFIQNLPHHLIHAFRSTLDEVAYADGILIVVDFTDPYAARQLEVTKNQLIELGASDKEILLVYNKCDLYSEALPENTDNTVYLSAAQKTGMGALISRIEQMVNNGKKRVCYCFPPTHAGKAASLYGRCTVESVDYTEAGTVMTVLADSRTRGMYAEWEITCAR